MSFLKDITELGKAICGIDDFSLKIKYDRERIIGENEKRRASVPKEIEFLYRYDKKLAEILPKAYYNSPQEKCLYLRQALEEFINSYEIPSDKMNLANKINYLQNEGIITNTIADKCHHIRKITNKGVHNSKVEISAINSCGNLLVDIILYKWPRCGDLIVDKDEADRIWGPIIAKQKAKKRELILEALQKKKNEE